MITSSLRVRGRVDWLVFDSDRKHLHQRLLVAIHQISVSEQ